MFKNALKALDDLKNNKVHIPIEADADGYIDRECPNNECLYQFKIHKDDWKNIVRDEAVYCPMCRKEANSRSWFTKEQNEQGAREAKKLILNALNDGFARDAKAFNAKQSKNAFFSLKLTFKSDHKPSPVLPISAMEQLELKITCKECNTRYAVLGSAFFCPSCGHNSAEETFGFSLDKIRTKLNSIPIVKDAFGKDEAAILIKNLIESSLLDIVVAFQRFCEVTFLQKCPGVSATFNAFQKLDAGSEYWRNNLGEGYEDWLTEEQLSKLKIYFQQRHLLSHSEGFIDQKYIDRSGDHTYVVGQRLVVKEHNILECLLYIQILADKIKGLLPLSGIPS